MDHQRFIEERCTVRILEIISGILDGGEGMEKGLDRLWSGLVFLRIFWEIF